MLILLAPFLADAQFIIKYNPKSNTLSVEYTGCDICTLGNTGAVSICECRNGCENYPPSVLQEYDDCRDLCYEDHGQYEYNYTLLNECYERCEYDLLEYTSDCKSACGPAPQTVRTIIGYEYELRADWANIPLDPLASTSNLIVNSFPFVSGSNVNIANWTLPSPWPSAYNDKNTCYGIQIKLSYIDGSCTFTRWICHLVG